MHCFSLSGSVYECIERGYYCSFAGNVTYPQADELREAAKVIPDELLLVETDAPFLCAAGASRQANEPAFVRSTAAFLAELRGQTYEQLEEVVQSNAGLDLPLVSDLARAREPRADGAVRRSPQP